MAYRLDALKPFLALPEPFKPSCCPYCNGTKDPTVKYPKPEPFKWFKETLGDPKKVVAPMVEQSELPFRMLCKKYGADLAYTPMFNSKSFAESAKYRDFQFSTCPEDRPMFVQLCGHDAEIVLEAARHVEDKCDAVDLNLGCPQGIARKGHYGSFLMEHWDTIHTVLHTLSVELKVPVTVKCRLFDDFDLSLRYVRMLRDTGVHLITVHGRTRLMKGQDTGIADLDAIAKIKQHITTVPIISNGNIVTFKDVAANLEKTKCDAVMSAEALLWDARIFSNPERPILTGRQFQADKATRLDAIALTKEYMEFVEKYPVAFMFVKAHLFKMLFHPFQVHPHLRIILSDIDNHDQKAIALSKDLLAKIEAAENACTLEGCYLKKGRTEKSGEPVATAAAESTEDQREAACVTEEKEHKVPQKASAAAQEEAA